MDQILGGGSSVIDLSKSFVGRNPNDLIVNSVDAHPNAQINREVANIVLDRIFWLVTPV